MKGTYVLLAEVSKPIKVRTGALGVLEFGKGFYAYVGSGMNSLEKRIGRHFLAKKTKHWHIDYFLEKAKSLAVFYAETGRKEECGVSARLAEKFKGVRGFGCSDCGCASHLYYSENRKELEREAVRSLRGSRPLRRILRKSRAS